jgi:RND family efflux transporter MFP subunit
MRPAVPFRVVSLAAALSLAAATGCSRQGKPAPVGGSDVPPSKVNLRRGVDLCPVEQRPLIYRVETTGSIEPERQTVIGAGIDGIVEEVLFREGDVVDPADDRPLVKIEQKRYQAAVARAKAVLESKAADVIARDEDHQRTRQARDQRMAATELDVIKARAAWDMAKADKLAAEADLDLANHNLLRRSQVRPRFRGQVNDKRVTEGDYVKEGAPIATIADLSKLRLRGYAPENAAPILRSLLRDQPRRLETVRTTLPLGGFLSGSPLLGVAGLELRRQDAIPSGFDPEFTIKALPQYRMTTRLFFMSDVGDPATRMFEIKGQIDTRFLPVQLLPNYSATIDLPLASSPDACVVPEEAVRSTERGYVAYEPVERPGPDGKPEYVARLVPVEIGYRAPGWVEVRTGLRGGQWIVRRGADALEDGSPLRIPEDQVRAMKRGG